MVKLIHPRSSTRGVTLVEMVVVMVIVGILAVTGYSRFNNTNSFHERGFTDEALAAIHYAHRLATSGGCHIRVQVAGGNLSVSIWPTCAPSDHSIASSPVTHPDNSGTFVTALPSGLTVGSMDIYVDRRGRPYNTTSETLLGSATSLAIGGRSVFVGPESGFAYE